MTIRTRKFIGTIALLLLVVVWSLLGMAAAQMPWLAEFRTAAGDLLCRRRDRLGAAGDADRELDGAAGRVSGRLVLELRFGSCREFCVGPEFASARAPARGERGNIAPDSITRMARNERSRPSQEIRGSANRLLRPAGSTTPG